MSETGDDSGPYAEIVRVIERADALEGFGRLEEAIAEVRRGLAEHPESSALWSSLAWLHCAVDDAAAAREAAESALALDPDSLGALHTMVLLDVRAGAAAGAHAAADRMLQLAPDHPAAHLDKARALAGEPAGATRNGPMIREAVHRAMALDPESASTVAQAAGILHGVAGKAELSQLIAHGLALDPANETLLLYASDAHTKHDGQVAGVLSSMLAQNPQQGDAAMQLSHIVWERTRWIPALAVWGMLALALPQAALAVLIASVINIWTLVHRVRRAAPKGFLRRTWGVSPWARTGVILGFAGAAWPLVVLPIVFWLRLPGLLALVPLVLLTGECLIVLAGDREARRLLAALGAEAETYAAGLYRAARKGWVRIAVGGIALAVGAIGLFSGAGPWMLPFGVVGLAFVVPAVLRILLSRDALQGVRRGDLREPPRAARTLVIASAVCAAGLAVASLLWAPVIPVDSSAGDEPTREPPSSEELQRTQQQLDDLLEGDQQRREDLERSMEQWNDSLRDQQQIVDDATKAIVE
ncbi:hypothetical protein [Leucobacter sp. GX0328]